MRDVSQHAQTDHLAYYMGEQTEQEQGLWGIIWALLRIGMAAPVLSTLVELTIECTHFMKPGGAY